MDSFAIGQQHHSKITPLALRNGRPSPNSSVGLNDLGDRCVHDARNPFVEDAAAIRARSRCDEILRALHARIYIGRGRACMCMPAGCGGPTRGARALR